MSPLSNLYMGSDIFSVSCSTHGVRAYFQSSDEISLKKMYLRPGWEDILRVVDQGAESAHRGVLLLTCSPTFHGSDKPETKLALATPPGMCPISFLKRCDALPSTLFLKRKDVSCNFMGFKYLILLLSMLKNKFRLSNF